MLAGPGARRFLNIFYGMPRKLNDGAESFDVFQMYSKRIRESVAQVLVTAATPQLFDLTAQHPSTRAIFAIAGASAYTCIYFFGGRILLLFEIYIHMYMYIYIHEYIYIYIHTYIHRCAHTCICISIHCVNLLHQVLHSACGLALEC